MTVVAGDIVDRGGVGCVVVDVAEDQAVLRTPEDLDLKKPIVVPIEGLEAVGHLGSGDGWTETAHGVWEKS